MASVNKTVHIGRLGRDVDLKFSASGTAVAKFSIACSESWTKDGTRQEKTEWINIVAFNKTAELCGQYLAKGREVYVEGSMQTRTYDDKQGVKHYITEVVARNVQFLGGRSDGADRTSVDTGVVDNDQVPF